MTANFTHSLDEQSAHVAYILKQLDKKNMKYVEASEEAESDWINTIISKARNIRKASKRLARLVITMKVSQIQTLQIIPTEVGP